MGRETIAQILASEAKAFTFDELPPDVIHHAKRSLLDGVGIAIGGYLSEPSRVLQSFIEQADGRPESSVFFSGVKTSCLNATLVNGAMVRYLDYMDRTFLTKDAPNQMGHHGESIVPVLAVAERQHSSGRDVITAVVAAYELLTKLSDSIGGNHDGILRSRGWAAESMRTPCAMALVAGRLLDLTEDQLANALALAACYSPAELGILHSGEEEVTMARNLRFPYAAYSGIFSALLAQKGFKGPLNVFEGRHGVAEVVSGGKMDLEKLRQPLKGWSIVNTWIKNFCADGNMHGHIEATLNLVNTHDIRANDIASVRIRVNQHTYDGMANPATRRHPKTKYTADHSSYYATAVAILDRAVGPEQFTEERVRDPRVQALSDKVTVEPDPALLSIISSAIVEIFTTKGQTFRAEVMRPKGHPMNPLTDGDLEMKFRSMATNVMAERQMSEIVAAIGDLEKFDDIGSFMSLLTLPAYTTTRTTVSAGGVWV